MVAEQPRPQPDWNVAARALGRAFRDCNKVHLVQQITMLEGLMEPLMDALRTGKSFGLRQFLEFDVNRAQRILQHAASILLVLDGRPPAGEVCMPGPSTK